MTGGRLKGPVYVGGHLPIGATARRDPWGTPTMTWGPGERGGAGDAAAVVMVRFRVQRRMRGGNRCVVKLIRMGCRQCLTAPQLVSATSSSAWTLREPVEV